MNTAIATERNPTTREVREACTTPLNTSRPRSSVPIGWPELGAWKASKPRVCGGCDVKALGNAAPSRKRMRTASAAGGGELWAYWRHHRRDAEAAGRPDVMTPTALAKANPRIQARVKEIGNEIGHDDPDGRKQEDTH